jgi:hypothetical protein
MHRGASFWLLFSISGFSISLVYPSSFAPNAVIQKEKESVHRGASFLLLS